MKNITNNINDVPVAGTDLFADSESFLNELTDSEIAQIIGGADVDGNVNAGPANVGVNVRGQSDLSLLLCI